MRNELIATLVLLLPAACSSSEQMPIPPVVEARLRGEEPPSPPPSVRDDEACRVFKWPLTPGRATEVLKRTQMFTQTGVYISGEPPPQIAAFNVLMDQPDPLVYLDDIARSGRPAGRLYALCAYQLIDQARRARLAAELRTLQTTVYTQFGCTGMNESVAELVEVVEKHEYGPYFRKAKARTYAYYDGPANICMQRTAGDRSRSK